MRQRVRSNTTNSQDYWEWDSQQQQRRMGCIARVNLENGCSNNGRENNDLHPTFVPFLPFPSSPSLLP